LLKPLERAIAAGDHIHGVILGSGINHGGKTNGYTVPNPQAQARVVAQALREAGVDARQIGYVEAHGTGTSLGDPIEIAGLTQAFAQFTADRQYCAIGSVKSNIGHLESAAGIAGLAKVLLQMRHGELVPSLHAQELNPHIGFEDTPFRVQRTLESWPRPQSERDGESREMPRIAGLSSFGAGGANAHLIVREYIAPPLPAATAPDRPQVVPLSARSGERLSEQVRRLLAHLEREAPPLDDLAYTLQVGREAMDHRLAFVVGSLDELRTRLRDYLEQGPQGAHTHHGEVRRQEALALFGSDDELRHALDRWIERGKYGRLLALWVQGVPVDWRGLHAGRTPRRVSLPTYPF
ncbi:type I polyketide synthase, partial [Xanthomonas arboricola]